MAASGKEVCCGQTILQRILETFPSFNDLAAENDISKWPVKPSCL